MSEPANRALQLRQYVTEMYCSSVTQEMLIGAADELDRLTARVAELEATVERVAEGIEQIHYPKEGAGREWVDDLGVYLRGAAAAILLVDPTVMRELEAIAALQPDGEGK